MNPFSSLWTEPMRQSLATLQQQPLLRHLLTYAEQQRVQLYVVGGTLRDICLGRSPQDLDLALAGDALGFARRLANQLGAAYVPLDEARGEARLVYRKYDVVDLAHLRGDDISEDLCHRDFTINAMAGPLESFVTHAEPELIDPHGGFQDIQARRIRMVSPLSFEEDPLRLLRAFRFAACLECTIDPATLLAVEAAAPGLFGVAVERIHSELFKLFSATHSSPHIVTMAGLGLLDVLFPERSARGDPTLPVADRSDRFGHAIDTYVAVEDLMNNPQAGLPAIPEEIVTYLQHGERPALLKCAALMHTIGNPPSGRQMPCREPSCGCPTSPDGTAHAALKWEEIGGRLKLSRQRIDYVELLLAQRHQPFALATLDAQGDLPLRLVHGWSKELGEDLLGVFALAIGEAMACGQHDTPAHGTEALRRCAVKVWELYRQRILPVLKSPRLVTGDDLQGIFQLAPGPRFKTLLDALEVAQVEGDVRSRADALQWMEQQLKQS